MIILELLHLKNGGHCARALPCYQGINRSAESLNEGSDVDIYFSLKGLTLRTIHSFLIITLFILAMFTMSRKVLKHVN